MLYWQHSKSNKGDEEEGEGEKKKKKSLPSYYSTHPGTPKHPTSPSEPTPTKLPISPRTGSRMTMALPCSTFGEKVEQGGRRGSQYE